MGASSVARQSIDQAMSSPVRMEAKSGIRVARLPE